MTMDRSARAGATTPAAKPTDRPTRIGRFLVLDSIGSGSMGVVYAAYDPELDRKVAVKLLHPTLTQSSRESTARARLFREAQAMARLSHPNVASVFDVGTIDRQVFIAMEFIQGKTLKAWLRERPKSRRFDEVLAAFVQAGRGLAAAHRAGITHRDFKPENALIDDDGRVRVLDFGLARTEVTSTVELDENELLRSADITRSDFGSLKLTRAGNLTGTPAYMAPEQLMRKPADARSDQFSFCVALYEALYGKRPFRGKTLATLKKNVIAGRVPDPPVTARVPSWVFRVLTRGLEVRPSDRYPSMDELLAELDRDPGRNRRRMMYAATALAGLLLGGYGYRVALGNKPGPDCSSGHQQLAGIWDSARRQQLAAAMDQSGVSFARETWELLAPRIETYANEWAAHHNEVCAATHVHGAQSEHLLDLRMACLRDNLDDLKQLTQVLETPTPAVVEHAVTAVGALPSLDLCDDTRNLKDPRTLAQPEIAGEVERLRGVLRATRTQLHTGLYQPAITQLQTISPEVEALDFGPLLAAMRLLSGRLHIRSGNYQTALTQLEQAYFVSESSADDGVRTEAATTLVDLHRILADYPGAHRWERHAQALVDRMTTDNSALRTSLLNIQGKLALSEGAPARAQTLHSRALKLALEAFGEDDPRLAGALGGIAIAYRDQGDYPRALEFSNRVITLLERSLGPNHPDVARAFNSRGGVYYLQLELTEAEQDFRRALELTKLSLGPDHPNLAKILNSLGALEEDLGHDDAAMQHYQHALTLIEKSLGADHPEASMVHNNLATLLMVLQRPQEARSHYERSLAIDRRVFGERHPNLGYAYQNLGDVEVAQNHPDEAVTRYQAALEVWQQAYGDTHPLLAHPLTSLGEQALARGDLEQARTRFARAVRIREQAFGPQHSDLSGPLHGLGNIAYSNKSYDKAAVYLARALEVAAPETLEVETLESLRFDYARALWNLPDRDAAKAQAQTVEQNLRAANLADSELLTRVQAWRRQHR